MQFVEHRRESLRMFDHNPETIVVSGDLSSPRGRFRSQLRSCGGKYGFVVTLHGDAETTIGILEDLERAFRGHLRDENT